MPRQAPSGFRQEERRKKDAGGACGPMKMKDAVNRERKGNIHACIGFKQQRQAGQCARKQAASARAGSAGASAA